MENLDSSVAAASLFIGMSLRSNSTLQTCDVRVHTQILAWKYGQLQFPVL